MTYDIDAPLLQSKMLRLLPIPHTWAADELASIEADKASINDEEQASI